MPLTPADRRFVGAVDRLKGYVLSLALVVFLFVLSRPANEITLATSVVICALCGLLWVTQRLLTVITVLDLELTKAVDVLKRTLSEEQRRELLRQ